MNQRDLAAGSIGAAAARVGGAVAAFGLLGTAIVGLQSAAASPTAPTVVSSSTASVSAVSDARVDWADVARPVSGSVTAPARVDSLPAGAVLSTQLVRLDGGSVTGVLFDPDRISLAVDATAAPGRYGVTVHVVRGGAEIARTYDEFEIR